MILPYSPTVLQRTLVHLLDPGCFASWLHAQSPTRRLYDDEGGRCTLAVYLHDEGMSHPTVSQIDVWVDGLEAPVSLPRWARAFIFDLDHTPHADYRDDIIAVFEATLREFADRDRPQGFEDWQASGKGAA